jgi:hypothetical protein
LAAFKRGTAYSAVDLLVVASSRDRPELAADHDNAEDRLLQIDRLDVQVVDDRLMRIEAGELEGVPEYGAGFRDRLLSRCGVDDPRSTNAPVLADGAGAFYELAFIDRFVDYRTDGGGDLGRSVPKDSGRAATRSRLTTAAHVEPITQRQSASRARSLARAL